MPLCRERLNHVEAINFLPESGRGELRTSVSVEHYTLGDASEPDCIPQCINGEKTVDFAGVFMKQYFKHDTVLVR